MTDKTITPPSDTGIKRAASELAVGDRIAANFLPCGLAAEVLFTAPHSCLNGHADCWVLVVYRLTDGRADAEHFLADALIPLSAVADTGMDFSDLADRLNTESAPVPTTTAGWANGDRSGALVEVHPAEPAAPTSST